MPKFKKIPVIIEAEQFDGTRECAERLQLLARGGLGPLCWAIHTLEGEMIVNSGDWVITGVKGERYPCKPDIFAMTYERVIETKEPGVSKDCG